MRHGKSDWSEIGLPDHDRGLTRRGKRDSRRMGQEMRARGLVPDLVLSSTAKRARSTARRVAKAMEYDGEVVYEPGLYFDGLGRYFHALAGLGEEVRLPLVIGHNPLLEDLIEALTREQVRLPTATVARLELAIEAWAELGQEVEGTLRLVICPRELARR